MATVKVSAVHPEMTRQSCQLILNYVQEHFGELLPDRLYDETPRGPKEVKVAPERLPTLMNTWNEQRLHEVQLWNSAETFEAHFQSFDPELPTNWFEVQVAEHLCTGPTGQGMLQRLDGLARAMILCNPLAVNICLFDDFIHESRKGQGTPFRVLWRNYWSPQLLRWIGEKAVCSADWLRVEELPDGWLCFDVYPTPFDYLQPECMQRRVTITESLKISALNSTAKHAMWIQRPLTKRWPEAMPDTPLLGG